VSSQQATPTGGLCTWGAQVLLVDSIVEAVGRGNGQVVISGSHGGASAARYALETAPLLVVFNDAGVGKDEAGIAALPLLQGHGIAACAVSHASARIGQARSTVDDGVISHCNLAAAALGCRAGARLRDWLFNGSSAESSPDRR
jgi:hypothetical protein